MTSWRGASLGRAAAARGAARRRVGLRLLLFLDARRRRAVLHVHLLLEEVVVVFFFFIFDLDDFRDLGLVRYRAHPWGERRGVVVAVDHDQLVAVGDGEGSIVLSHAVLCARHFLHVCASLFVQFRSPGRFARRVS